MHANVLQMFQGAVLEFSIAHYANRKHRTAIRRILHRRRASRQSRPHKGNKYQHVSHLVLTSHPAKLRSAHIIHRWAYSR
jgi:hypothetical protein